MTCEKEGVAICPQWVVSPTVLTPLLVPPKVTTEPGLMDPGEGVPWHFGLVASSIYAGIREREAKRIWTYHPAGLLRKADPLWDGTLIVIELPKSLHHRK